MDVILHDFSIKQIADSGQCFRIIKNNNTWTIYHQHYCLVLKRLSAERYYADCDNEAWQKVWYSYFDLGTDYSKIKQLIQNSNDIYLQTAANFGSGLRILRQDLLESIIVYIISQNNNISRITKTVNAICTPFFPNISELVAFSTDDWRAFGTGYRANYLCNAVKKIYDGTFSLDKLRSMDYKSAVNYLKTLNGVGDKVANCIALFGLHHMDAFPQDVWIKRIIVKHYHGLFPIEKYYDWLGIVQQYMFYYERSAKLTNQQIK